MLKLKPSCENCNSHLPPDSQNAMICSYECTFCRDCVDQILHNVCPNCGGGFVDRPTRPAKAWRQGVSLKHHPASQDKVFKPVNPEEHDSFASNIREIDPRLR